MPETKPPTESQLSPVTWLLYNAYGNPLEQVFRKKDKPLRQCALPGCTKMSEKEYCSAAHCREHNHRKKKQA